ncbi:MAG: hypothetical protein LAP61_10205 [Acidobacteriia bacterium]|nr:hypothetical protein [Terriglobia bacterium]
MELPEAKSSARQSPKTAARRSLHEELNEEPEEVVEALQAVPTRVVQKRPTRWFPELLTAREPLEMQREAA